MDEQQAKAMDERTKEFCTCGYKKALMGHGTHFAECPAVRVREMLSRARAEALEEAKQRILMRCCEKMKAHGFCEHQPCDYYQNALTEIQALITTPAPATIPVERVREAMLTANLDPEQRGIFLEACGVDLDARGEASAPDIVRQAQGSYPLPVSRWFVNLRCRHCSSVLFIVNDVGDERCSGCGRDWAPVSP